jgi:hypothetical protein
VERAHGIAVTLRGVERDDRLPGLDRDHVEADQRGDGRRWELPLLDPPYAIQHCRHDTLSSKDAAPVSYSTVTRSAFAHSE